jgi:hypothetical protein
MNRLLLAALTVAVAGSAAASAQQTELPELPQIRNPYLQPAPVAPTPSAASAEAQAYFYFTQLGYHRIGPDAQGVDRDSNEFNVPVPLQVGTVQVRGIGQFFAPKYLHTMLSGSVYNETSGLIGFPDTSTATDQDYINQFKNAGAFTIDEILFSMYKNFTQTLAPTTSPAAIVIYKTTTNFASPTFVGFSEQADKLTSVFETEYTPEGIDTTLDAANSRFNRTHLVFDPPLEFADGESAIFMYQNTEAAAGNTSSDDIQLVRTYLETPPDTGRKSIDVRRTFGAALMRAANGIDSIKSMYRALSITGVGPLAADAAMTITGTVEIGAAGVRYHFGTEIGGQGVKAISPNPVSADTRIPFTLTERAHITLDLFATGGEHVRSLVDETYVPGNYTAPLAIGDLENGVYLVRMTAGSKVYTQKIVINR